MNTSDFEAWMLRTGNDPAATRSRTSNLRRLEQYYEELDALYERDNLTSLLTGLAYTKDDDRAAKLNPSPVPIDGNLYNGLATLRAAVNLYKRFREEFVPSPNPEPPLGPPDAQELTFSLERDLQTALRASIAQLEDGLVIIDGGTERNVPSGRIDILAQDRSGAQVVIELKAVRAGREAIAQILSYMGDIQEQGASAVRGILVAPEFDDRALSAARMARGLFLVTYAYKFSFTKQTLSERGAA